MSSRHKRIYGRRPKGKHIICINCNAVLKFDDGQTRYRRRYPLTNRLQDRKWDPSRKPGISILEGLIETMPDLAAGDISQFLSTMCICHECTILLRQVVNCKFKVQNLLVEFQQKIGDITNEMRLDTNKQAKQSDTVVKCWACQQKFPKEEAKYRCAMHKHIVHELTVKEAIESVLPDECVTIQGTPEKYLMICKSCFKSLSKIITAQCQAETTKHSFMERTNENGLISKIQEHGEDFDAFDDLAEYVNDVDDDVENDNDVDDDDTSENIEFGDSESQNENIVVVTSATPADAEESSIPEETVIQSLDTLSSTNPIVGTKRKLDQTDFEVSSEVVTETFIDESFEEDNYEYYEESEDKRRKTVVDVLSILQATNSQNEELQMTEIGVMDNDELEDGRLIIPEETGPEALNENVMKKIVYYLQKNSLHKAFKTMRKYCGEFEKEIQKLVLDYILKETSKTDSLEKSDWSKLSSLHSGNVTIGSFIEAFKDSLPLFSSILSCSITGQTQLDFKKIEKKTLLRLLTVMGIIAFERNPNCHVIQSLNSIQMAEDGCTNELYNTFFGLGLCLKDKESQQLLASPDYSTHQVCWDLLKEKQEEKGSISGNWETDKGKDDDEISEDDNDNDDSVPEDFAAVCPYWRLPVVKTPVHDNEESAQWVLYSDLMVPSRAELIKLIFEEAGVGYQECSEPFDNIEIVGGKTPEYPAFSPPVVRKGNLTLTEVPVICRHLGEMLDLCPESTEDKIHAEQISHICHDFLLEGRAFDGTETVAKSSAEKERGNPHKESFIKNRIPRFLSFFESALKANNDGSGFFFGDKITYADLTVFHVLKVTERQFPQALEQAIDIHKLKAFRERLSLRPKLKVYMNSDRCKL